MCKERAKECENECAKVCKERAKQCKERANVCKEQGGKLMCTERCNACASICTSGLGTAKVCKEMSEKRAKKVQGRDEVV